MSCQLHIVSGIRALACHPISVLLRSIIPNMEFARLLNPARDLISLMLELLVSFPGGRSCRKGGNTEECSGGVAGCGGQTPPALWLRRMSSNQTASASTPAKATSACEKYLDSKQSTL